MATQSRPDVRPIRIAAWTELADREPAAALVAGVDLVVVRHDDRVSVLHGRCLHRAALLADGRVEGPNLVCGLHGWSFRIDTGVSERASSKALKRFAAWIDESEDAVLVDEAEIAAWAEAHPQPYRRDEYLGAYADPQGTPLEPHVSAIHELATHGLERIGPHGRVSAMGVPIRELPQWDDLQLLTAQLARRPLADDAPVRSDVVIGPRARRPLRLDLPLFVSDMSFGALSAEAKVALARGAERAGTGICSGEGGMLPDEQAECSRYFYELASARFGWRLELAERVQAFHFKGGQAAKTGTGGHLPGRKVTPHIAQVRGLQPGRAAISPSRFEELVTPADFRALADQVREASGGIPVGFKLSAQHVEDDLDFVLEIGVDYVILDGRGGGTGAAPNVFKSNISVPTMAALARARRHLDRTGAADVTLVATGGFRTESDFVKALALGADAVAVSNAALQAIGCLGMRACHTNNCPVGIATQREHLRSRLDVELSARRLERWFGSTLELMKLLARACGHEHLSDFSVSDLTAWRRDVAELAGVRWAGAGADPSSAG